MCTKAVRNKVHNTVIVDHSAFSSNLWIIKQCINYYTGIQFC